VRRHVALTKDWSQLSAGMASLIDIYADHERAASSSPIRLDASGPPRSPGSQARDRSSVQPEFAPLPAHDSVQSTAFKIAFHGGTRSATLHRRRSVNRNHCHAVHTPTLCYGSTSCQPSTLCNGELTRYRD
jgi:hypothetical protein